MQGRDAKMSTHRLPLVLPSSSAPGTLLRNDSVTALTVHVPDTPCCLEVFLMVSTLVISLVNSWGPDHILSQHLQGPAQYIEHGRRPINTCWNRVKFAPLRVQGFLTSKRLTQWARRQCNLIATSVTWCWCRATGWDWALYKSNLACWYRHVQRETWRLHLPIC